MASPLYIFQSQHDCIPHAYTDGLSEVTYFQLLLHIAGYKKAKTSCVLERGL